MPEFSVVTPTYNEAENIEDFINVLFDILEGIDFELIIVDDDSPDLTWKVARNTTENNRVKVIRRKEKKDLSKSIIDGFKETNSEKIAVIDADFQHPPKKLVDIYYGLDDNDIVICSRNVSGGKVESWSLNRKIISRVAEKMAKQLFSELGNVKDPLSGYFGLNKDVIDNVDLNPEGYKILIEILVKCDYDKIIEIPYIFQDRDRGSSSINIKEYYRYLKHIIRLKRDITF